MIQKLKTWYFSLPAGVRVMLHGLFVAVEGGVIGFLTQWAANPQPLCFNKACLHQFAGAFAGAVIAAVRNWLKQSPLAPPVSDPVPVVIAESRPGNPAIP